MNESKMGVSQKAIVFNKEKKFLALRRSETHPYKPFSWDLPGGDLDFGEDPEEGIKRETKEESNLDIFNIIPLDVEGHMTPDGSYWVTIAYTAECDSNNVILSYEHDQFQWVDKEEFLKLESSEKLRRFVEKLT